MWGIIAIAVVLAVVAISNMPKPQSQKPAGIDEVELPTAEEGREIPVLFGCRRISGPNVIWYGDMKTKRIRSKSGKK